MKKLLLLVLFVTFSCSKDSAVAEPAPLPPVVVVPPTPQFDLVVNASVGGSVSSPGGTYDEGTSVTITASPIEGYEFTGWSGSNETSNVVSINLNANITLTANFGLIEVAENQFTATITAGAGGEVSTPGGTLNEGTILSITATANEGYEFTGWTGTEEISNVISITLSANITLTANFQLVETQFTATIISGTGGVVSTPGGTLNEGSVLSITATANDGYEFIGWTGSEEVSNVISITLIADITLTANFQLIQVAINYYSSGELLTNNNISAWFNRSLDVYGVRLLVAGAAGGQPAVSDEFAKKVAQLYKLLINKDAVGINTTAQEKMIRILSGDIGFHQGFPTGQRIGYGNAGLYSPNPLTDEGCNSYSGLCSLNDSMSLKDMIWYMSPDNSGQIGDNVIVEVFEHVLHTLQYFGTIGAVEGSLEALNMSEEEDITGTELFLAMKEAYENGVFGIDDYGGDINNSDKFPIMLIEYQYLLTFGMWEFGTKLWEGGSLEPEWSDNANTPEGIQQNNPLGFALFNNYIAPVLSKPSIASLRLIFQDNDGGVSGYVPD
jgi:uncharacterized repeat protein (TIGR02543 family)